MRNANETVCAYAQRIAREKLAAAQFADAARVLAAGAGAMLGLVSGETLGSVLEGVKEQKPIIAPNAVDYSKL
jgi:hypothetical protein